MEEIKTILSSYVEEKRTILTEFESKHLLKLLGLPIPTQILVNSIDSPDEVLKSCETIGFPVVMKLMAKDIVHKSDQGAVKLNILTSEDAIRSFDDLMKIPSTDPAKCISIQEMAKKPVAEIIIGSNVDSQFGPTIMFGIGGVLVEIMKDVSFRVAPLNDFDVDEMIHEIKGFKLLEGYRGKDPADIDSIKNLIKKVSNFIHNTPQVVEMDLNPVFLYKEGVTIVDARIILK